METRALCRVSSSRQPCPAGRAVELCAQGKNPHPSWDGESIQKARPRSRRPPAPFRPPQPYLAPSPCPVQPPPAAAPPRPARGAASSRPPRRGGPTLRDRQGRVSGSGRAAPRLPRHRGEAVRGLQVTARVGAHVREAEHRVRGQEWEGARRVGNTLFGCREPDLSSQQQPGQGSRGG